MPITGGGYARGVVSRLNGHGVVFGYFFGPKFVSAQTAPRDGLIADQAILIGMFGDLGFVDKTWIVVGQVPQWAREEWPLPPLVSVDPHSTRVVLSTYDENTLEFVGNRSIDASEMQRFPRDGTMGAGAVESRLSKLLDG